MPVHTAEETAHVVDTAAFHDNLHALDVDGLVGQIATIESELERVESVLREYQVVRRRLLEQRVLAKGVLTTKQNLAALNDEGIDVDLLLAGAGGRELFDSNRPRSAADAVRAVLRAFPRHEWTAEEIREAISEVGWGDAYRLHAVQVALGRMHRAGEVHRVRRGVYRGGSSTSAEASAGIPELVEELLVRLGITQAPVPLEPILEHFGVGLQERQHQPEDALLVPRSSQTDGSSSVLTIYYNPRTPSLSRRSAIARELGHVVLRQGQGPTDARFRSPRGDERRANAFAAELLTPESFVRTALLEIGADINVLTKRFEVSITAMRLRLEELGIDPLPS